MVALRVLRVETASVFCLRAFVSPPFSFCLVLSSRPPSCHVAAAANEHLQTRERAQLFAAEQKTHAQIAICATIRTATVASRDDGDGDESEGILQEDGGSHVTLWTLQEHTTDCALRFVRQRVGRTSNDDFKWSENVHKQKLSRME